MSRTRLVTVVFGLVGSCLLCLVGSGSASAVDVQQITSARDASGDVRVYSGQRLSLLEKRSVDLRQVSVQRVDRQARITVRINSIIRVPRFDQMFFVRLTEPMDPAMGAFATDIGFTSKGRLSYAIIADRENPDSYDECDNFTVVAHPRLRTVTATIPFKCVPDNAVKVTVSTVTGLFRSDARTYSSDRLTVPGYHEIL